MKKTLLNMLTALGLGAVLLLNGCGSSGDKAPEETQATTCTVEQIPPTGWGIITLKVSCQGEVDINSATVTVNTELQTIDIGEGGTVAESILYFYNVEPSSTYQAVLDIIKDGEVFKVVKPVFTGTFETQPVTPVEPEPVDPVDPEPVDPTPTNKAPTANDLTVDAQGAETKSGTIVINDPDGDNSQLIVEVTTPPAHGSVVWNTQTGFTYTVTNASFYNGNDEFKYKVREPVAPGSLESTIKTVTILDIIDL